jgi:hypothetical protein
MRAPALAFGITPNTTGVAVTHAHLVVRFGPWRLATPLDNIEGAELSGPYRLWKVVGGARLSLADSGITFATNTRRGLCLRFREPVPAALPLPFPRHSAATLTVADPDGLVAFLGQRTAL